MKFKSLIRNAILACGVVTMTASCSPFVFIGQQTGETNNCIFFALYNYYGEVHQHFTNKWLGMADAMEAHGYTVTGWESEMNARKFKITRGPNSDLPEDMDFFMVNNRTWNPDLQFTRPITKHKPLAIISTCNGVEFAAQPIKASGLPIQNATIGGFSDSYHKAFKEGGLHYLVSKYSGHVAPIFAACVDAVDKGSAMKNADGTALHLSIENWAVKSLEDYEMMERYDQVVMDKEHDIHPTIMKANLDPFFNVTGEERNGAALEEWVKQSKFEQIKALYESNAHVVDTRREGRQLSAGIITPSTMNDAVKAYVTAMTGYLADVYNVKTSIAEVSGNTTQSRATTNLINSGVDFIISVQDDNERNAAIQMADEAGIYFGIVGNCQNPKDYDLTKNVEHFVGSIGTSIEEERRAAKEMTEYYIQQIIDRNK